MSSNLEDDNAEEVLYKPPPPNHGASPPFGVLSRLFERLQQERKFDKRRRAVEVWFKVQCILVLVCRDARSK
jgi:hypothetical protein